jgi:hypothetical protein
MNDVNIRSLGEIAELEFGDIVTEVFVGVSELRLVLVDGSLVDVWFSQKLKGRYSYHWERRALDNTIYRYDNAPHRRWESVSTFPAHYHDGSEANVIASDLSAKPHQALRQFLSFIRARLTAS